MIIKIGQVVKVMDVRPVKGKLSNLFLITLMDNCKVGLIDIVSGEDWSHFRNPAKASLVAVGSPASPRIHYEIASEKIDEQFRGCNSNMVYYENVIKALLDNPDII